MIVIDSHQHLWDLDYDDYAWLDEQGHSDLIRRTFSPDDLVSMMNETCIYRGVLIHAGASIAESLRCASLAADNPRLLGAVVSADLRMPDVEQSVITMKNTHPAVCGVRVHLGTAVPSQGFLDALDDHGLTLDVLVSDHSPLDEVASIARRNPGLLVVLDHLGRPDLRRARSDWETAIAGLASLDNVRVKVSGFGNLVGFGSYDELPPYVAHLYSTLGAGRMMWGSDWPVCLENGGPGVGLAHLRVAISDLSTAEQQDILGRTALRTYYGSFSTFVEEGLDDIAP